MSTISKASLSTLRRRADDLFAVLASTHPFQVQELKLLLEMIRQREESTGGDLVGIRSPRRAIQLCLIERGAVMSKQEIIDRLAEGGFVKDVEVEKWLINDNINLGVKRGVFTREDDLEGLNAKVGLPSFQRDSRNKTRDES